jgi:hypothetical protein
MDTENPFRAAWSQQGHTLCLGHWQVFYLDRELTLPEAQQCDHMGTFGNFSYLFQDDPDWEEGLQEDDWIVANIDWLSDWFDMQGIPLDESCFRWFYQAVNAVDWRCSACGGCI